MRPSNLAPSLEWVTSWAPWAHSQKQALFQLRRPGRLCGTAFIGSSGQACFGYRRLSLHNRDLRKEFYSLAVANACPTAGFPPLPEPPSLVNLPAKAANGVASMLDWFTPDVFIVLVTVFIAISALGRLMLRKRNQLLNELSRQAHAAERKRKIEERKAANQAA